MVDSSIVQRASRRKIMLSLSVGSLAAAGLIAAIGVLFGGDTWKSIATAMLIFGLNLLVLVSFTAAHGWLKIAQRTAAVLAVAGSLYYLWVDVPYSWEYDSSAIPTATILRDWILGSWIAVTTLSLLCFLSLAWRFLKGSTLLRLSYALSFSLAISSSAIFWVVAGTSSSDYYGIVSPSLMLIGSALAILAAAASLIVIIGALVERAKGRQENVAVQRPSSSLREDLISMAQSGELLEILSHSPELRELLNSQLNPTDQRKTDDQQIADSAV